MSPSTGSTTGEPPHQSAYRAGYEVGEKVYDTSGKGAAVKEIVGGGCVDRALAAGVPEGARPAWVQGCKDGVSKTPPTPQGS
ncbi:hypothetical protein ACIO3O_36390 [Streptomyces sp. NPDC087440]|uniref:hypothetical protein n=1 Tax=Streptomyces sp. NPDC087440 TaxID=3365790 RepID=UPI0038259EAC